MLDKAGQHSIVYGMWRNTMPIRETRQAAQTRPAWHDDHLLEKVTPRRAKTSVSVGIFGMQARQAQSAPQPRQDRPASLEPYRDISTAERTRSNGQQRQKAPTRACGCPPDRVNPKLQFAAG